VPVIDVVPPPGQVGILHWIPVHPAGAPDELDPPVLKVIPLDDELLPPPVLWPPVEGWTPGLPPQPADQAAMAMAFDKVKKTSVRRKPNMVPPSLGALKERNGERLRPQNIRRGGSGARCSCPAG
jgi:hypothetical protein